MLQYCFTILCYCLSLLFVFQFYFVFSLFYILVHKFSLIRALMLHLK